MPGFCIKAYPWKPTGYHGNQCSRRLFIPKFDAVRCIHHWSGGCIFCWRLLQISRSVHECPCDHRLTSSISAPGHIHVMYNREPHRDPFKGSTILTPSPTTVWTFNAITGHIGWHELRPRRPVSQREHKRFGWMVGDNPPHPSWQSL